MDPDMIKRMLQKRFEIERVYLEAEDTYVSKQRQKNGGNRNTKYTEGWVEFTRKKDAKLAAMALNGQQIGGKKRNNKYREDTWNIRYLSGFKWFHLTEKLEYDRKMRNTRLKSEMSRANKELQHY
jgi:ESF2/ABP1 family protein